MKDILFWFIECQIYFGMPRGDKNEFSIQRPRIGCFPFKLKHYLPINNPVGLLKIEKINERPLVVH